MTRPANETPYHEAFLDFICERRAIRLAKELGDTPPWTDDPILRKCSFTNIRREHDRTTRWIAKHWRKPYADELDLWFAMAVARFTSWPGTLAALGYPVP